MNSCIAPLCQSCLCLLRQVNDTISNPSQGLDPSPQQKAGHVQSLCFTQTILKEVASSASAGCRICSMALAQARNGKFTVLRWAKDDDDDEEDEDDTPWPGDNLVGRMDTGFLLSRPFEDDGLVSIRFYLEFRDKPKVVFGTLDEVLWLSPPGPGPGSTATKLVAAHDESVHSTKNFRQIKQWLAHCDQNHPDCGLAPARDGLAFTPSRLIDVGSADDSWVRLISNTENIRGERYTTLSYCWGGAQSLKLMSSNIRHFEEGFPLDDLPKTIREAAQVTQDISVRYLWVDSICIMQDSVDDWESEAVRMSDVYGCSYCTIMATESRNSDEGLFRSRVDSVVRPTWYKIWYKDEAASTVFMKEMSIEAEGEVSFYTKRLDDAPAANRAWIFQEHVLSRRVIHFTYDQLMWECQSTVTCESFPEGFSGNGVINDSYLWIPKLKPTGHMTATLKAISAMLRWANYVEAYSHREMSVPGDKLVAIGGIARRLAEIHGLDHSDYAAGLWKHNMPSCLLWTSLSTFSKDTPKSWHNTFAPSWSWAAIGGSVQYARSHVQDPARKSLVEVLDVQIEYVDRQIFGQAVSGTIKLSGRLISVFKPAWKNRGDSSHRSEKYKDPKYALLWTGQLARDVAFDANQGPITISWDVYGVAEEVLCMRDKLRGTYGLPIFYNAGARSLCGLLLLATDRRGEYRRLGLFREWIDPPDRERFYGEEGEGETGEWLDDFYDSGRFGGEIRAEDLHLYTDDESIILV